MKKVLCLFVLLMSLSFVGQATSRSSTNILTVAQHHSIQVLLSGKAHKVTLGDPNVLDSHGFTF